LEGRDKIWHTAKEVKEITGVNYKTQYGMVKRWVERGHKIVSLLCLRGSKIKIDEATRALIASPEQLMLQRHLSLEARAEYWREKLGLEKLSPWLVRQIYLEHGATFRKPQCTYVAKQERAAILLQQQKEFSKQMTAVVMKQPDTDIVYLDETTFHLWMSPGRVWLKKGMKVPMPDTRGHSICVIGALSIKHGLLLTHVFQGSNNADTFLRFIIDLKEKCRDSKTYVVMDNLSVHHAGIIAKQFVPFQFMAKFLPTYSCELNPIEKVWNLLKMRWRKNAHNILVVGKKKEDLMRAAIDQIKWYCDSFDPVLMRKMARGNFNAMAKSLQGYLV
jgi:transposase